MARSKKLDVQRILAQEPERAARWQTLVKTDPKRTVRALTIVGFDTETVTGRDYTGLAAEGADEGRRGRVHHQGTPLWASRMAEAHREACRLCASAGIVEGVEAVSVVVAVVEGEGRQGSRNKPGDEGVNGKGESEARLLERARRG